MAKRTTRAVMSSEYQLVPVEDLSGGVDLRHSPTLMKPNRARRCHNFCLKEPGALVTRAGWSQFSTASLGANPVQGGQRVYLEDAIFTLAAYGGSIYKPSDAGVWGSAVKTGYHASDPIHFAHDRDFAVALDGTTAPSKTTDGSTWTGDGIAAPTTAPTAAAVAGGSLVEGHTYEFSYTYRDAAGLAYEGNESDTVQQAAAGANLTVRVTVARSADPQVDTIAVYARDVTAGESVRRRTGTLANPAGATATYDVTADNWETGIEAPTTHNLPPAGKWAVVWKNRWWMPDPTVGNRLWFSELFLPQAWPGLYYIDIPFKRGDRIAAAVAQGDTLVIFGSSEPYLIIGQTSLDFEVRPAATAIAGALGPDAATLIEYGIAHASASGVYLFDGATDRLLSYDIDPGWQDLITRATAAALQKVALVYHEREKELRIAVPRLYPTGTYGEWVLDLNRTRTQEQPAWATTDRAIGGYLSWDGAETTTAYRGRLFSWSPTTGVLNEEATGTTANGSNLTALYQGPTLSLGLYLGRWIDLYGEYQPASGTLTHEVLIDGTSQGSVTETIGASLSVYGTAVYGTAVYGSRSREMYQDNLPLGAEGRAAQVYLQYVGQSTWRHYGYQIGVRPEMFARGM